MVRKGEFRIGPEWEEAHAIVQTMEGTMEFDWVHALLHWIEADMGNADYWYRRAGKKRSAPSVEGRVGSDRLGAERGHQALGAMPPPAARIAPKKTGPRDAGRPVANMWDAKRPAAAGFRSRVQARHSFQPGVKPEPREGKRSPTPTCPPAPSV